MTDHLYDSDTARWAEEQAKALRSRSANALDWDNLAEEIESLARSDRREIRNRLAIICQHLLKWEFQPARRSNSWRSSVREARRQIAGLVEESPTLAPYPATQLAAAYAHGREDAAEETGMLHLPADCPWSVEEVLDRAFWPGPPWDEAAA
jgi:uncharacterized protein DUF29